MPPPPTPDEHPRRRLARRREHEVGLSVVLCTFNGAPWLAELLDSLVAQTRLPDELIIQDDGSVDATIEIVRRLEPDLPFPVVIEVNSQRLGSTKNFEAALLRANGRIVALADQDDVWYPNKLERIMKEFDLDPTIVMVFSDADLIDESGRRLGRRLWDSRLIGRALRRNAVVSGDMFGRRALTTGCTMAVRRRAVAASLPFPDELADPESPMRHDRWLSLIAAGVGTVRPLPEPLLAFRVHPSQETGVLSPWELTTALTKAAGRSLRHGPATGARSHEVRAAQLEVAAARATEFGDFEGANSLHRLSGQHRRRVLSDPTVGARLRSVQTGVQQGMYGSDALSIGAVVADLARAVRPAPRRGDTDERTDSA